MLAEQRAPSLSSSSEQTSRINPDPKHFIDLGKVLLPAKLDVWWSCSYYFFSLVPCFTAERKDSVLYWSLRVVFQFQVSKSHPDTQVRIASHDYFAQTRIWNISSGGFTKMVFTSDGGGERPDGSWEIGFFSKSWKIFSMYRWGQKMALLLHAGLNTLLKQFILN